VRIKATRDEESDVGLAKHGGRGLERVHHCHSSTRTIGQSFQLTKGLLLILTNDLKIS
jgi:hypothetical protein